jgi:hypothetical protein
MTESVHGRGVTPVDQMVRELPEDSAIFMVLSTARRHGRGPHRLPDRIDRGRRIVAIQVETDEEASEVFRELDREGRQFFVDVERKHDLNLVAVALKEVRLGEVRTIKPNDTTVDALDAIVAEHFGVDLNLLITMVNGTGNLAFKFALRLAERGATVGLIGRDRRKASLFCEVLNAVLPQHTSGRVIPAGEARTQLLISAVTAKWVVTSEWLGMLADGALCVDVGIDNFSPEFVEGAHAAGHTCIRLDVRAAGDPLPAEPDFFRDIAGRSNIGGVPVVAGGYIGRLGEIVVDQISQPCQVVGVASGTGGLLDPESWTPDQHASVAKVRNLI